VEKKRQPPKGAKYIEGLENRLGRMESLLRLSGLITGEDADKTDLGTLEKRLADKGSSNGARSPRDSHRSPSTPRNDTFGTMPNTPQQNSLSSPKSVLASPEPQKEASKEEVEALADQTCSLVTNNCGETRYIGSSSGFSIFSPKGIQWVNEKTGDTSFQDMIVCAAADDNKWAHWKPEVFSDIFVRRTFRQLPPRDEALSLLKDYFENFNCMFPLFHEPTFMHLVDQQYSPRPYNSSGWWACLNVAFAIAHRLRVMSNLVPQEEDQKAWGYLKNALAVQTELTMKNNDLLSVQALLGMALFLQGTPNPQPSFFLVAAAIRASHSIGLHKRGSGFNLNAVEVEQRKRVFWIGYMLDRDLCLRSGRPPIQDDDDMNVDLPSEDPFDNIGNIPLANGKGRVNLFRLMCTFAVIASKVYKQLYSVKASKQSDGELLNTIGELDNELEAWKDGIPIDFRPEHEIKAAHTPLLLHVVVLHFAYYNCLTTIHRMSVHHGYWTSRLSNYAIQGLNARPLNPRVFSSAALCVHAARTSITLIKYIPQGDYACVWLVLYYPVSALVTLFANILQNPRDTRARSDLKLMNQVVNFLSMLCADEESGNVRRMLSVCSEFERIAKVVLDKGDKDHHARGKRSRPDDVSNDNKDASAKPRHPSSTAQQASQQQQEQAHKRPLQRDLSDAPLPSWLSSTATAPSTNTATPASQDTIYTAPGFAHDGSLPQHQPFSSLSDHAFNPALPSFTTPGPDVSWMPNQLPNTGFTSASLPQGAPGSFLPGAPFPDLQFSGMGDLVGGGGNGNGNADGHFGDGVDMQGMGDMMGMGSFQQPFVPQDLWQMPMTLEWDWADMSLGFEDGGGGGMVTGNGNGNGNGNGGGMDGVDARNGHGRSNGEQ
ncbi:hypothetical protein LTR04_004602, partial [Oleoguttula sp. CCFEE 6159]